jgi:hypothetical protein
MKWKKKCEAQYGIPLQLARVITEVRDRPLQSRRNFGMVMGFSGRTALREEQ